MISDNKLKIMLCEQDLKQFDIKAEELDYSNTDTKRMFWDVLSRAKHQTGFDTDGQRILVQLYPSKEGGCEMFVTKIGALSTAEEEKTNSQNKLSNDKSTTFTINQKSKKKKSTLFNLFSFDKTEDMIEVCRRLFDLGYIGESSAYCCDNGKRYLFLSDIDVSEYAKIDEFSFILEYGESECSKTIRYYIFEHVTPICETLAVPTLAKL